MVETAAIVATKITGKTSLVGIAFMVIGVIIVVFCECNVGILIFRIKIVQNTWLFKILQKFQEFSYIFTVNTFPANNKILEDKADLLILSVKSSLGDNTTCHSIPE